jgi:hypothetical protein
LAKLRRARFGQSSEQNGHRTVALDARGAQIRGGRG